MKKLKNAQNGFTLVEVLASIVLLTLIITTFMMMFAMGARTNVASEGLFDSTYAVQNEMEKLIELSAQPVSPPDRLETIEQALGYSRQSGVTENGTTWGRLSKQAGAQHVMDIRLEETTSHFVRVLVEVGSAEGGNPKAKMETLLIWEGEAP